jgi:BASS family bile acid:Na+ symporter
MLFAKLPWSCQSRLMDVAALDQLEIVLDPLGQAGIALALMLVMFSVALGLRRSDFQLLGDQPLLFFGGVATQVIGLPLLTYLVLQVVSVPASIALGMIVVACCPGGTTSNLMTFLARGNVAFSVSLTATSSVLAALLTPVSILFWSRQHIPTAELLDSIDVSPLVFLMQTTALLIVPLLAGMLFAAKWPALSERLRRRTAQAGVLVLGGVVVYGTIYFFPVLASVLPFLMLVAILHNAAAFLLGAGAGMVLRAAPDIVRALTFEVGIQNSGLAIVILIGQLKGLGGAAAIAAVWGVWHLVGGGIIVLVLRFIDRRKQMHES